jgi:alpha-ketoglutarate-dependent taurine dioxygenase
VNRVTTKLMYEHQRAPLIIEPPSSERDIAEFVAGNTSSLRERLVEHGAILFRGFGVREIAGFDGFVGALSEERIDYVYGSTPRTSIGDRIFTATEYPPQLEIPLHNENAYQAEWPLKIALCCLKPADSGGETPIADMRRVNAAIGESLIDKFEQRGVKYVRHYRPYVDVPWQKVFRTEDRNVVAEFCAAHDIAHEWLDADTLRTTQVCQGVGTHPVTRERTFFNQAHLFHVSSLGDAPAKSMIAHFGSDKLPRQTFFGDGGEIPAEDLARVRAAFAGSSIMFPWKAGDILLLDNMQFAHGRRPFKGTRQVVAALLEPHRNSHVY